MKIIIGLLFLLNGCLLQAQNWQSYNLSDEGLAVQIDFPQKPSREVKQQENKSFTFKAVQNSVTYVLQTTQSQKNLQISAINELTKRLLGKAQKADLEKNISLDNSSGKYIKYQTEKGAFVTSWILLRENTIFQLMVISMKGYPTDAEDFFKTFQFLSNHPKQNQNSALKGFIKTEKGKTVKLKGNVKDGKIIENLDFAQSSSMACFPGTRFVEFEGNHLFYWMDLPTRSEVTITVKPLTGKRINVYAYSGFDGQTFPPDVISCVSCEASYELWTAAYPPEDFTKSAGERSVQLRAIANPYKVLIAVAGAKGVTEGEFELKIEIQ